MKQAGVTLEYVKYLQECLTKLENDFTYLLHPSKLPRAYEKALIEVTRRRRFRKLVDEEVEKLKKQLDSEREKRDSFLNEYGKLLPSDFIPPLRDKGITMRIEGGLKDYELPEIETEFQDDVLDSQPQISEND